MSLNQISFQDFLKVEIYSGTILRVERFPEARRPAYKLWIEFGPKLGVKTASAKLTGLYSPEHLMGKQVFGVVNFSPRQVANFVSEVLLLGVPDENGQVVLLQPERRVPNGERVFDEKKKGFGSNQWHVSRGYLDHLDIDTIGTRVSVSAIPEISLIRSRMNQ